MASIIQQMDAAEIQPEDSGLHIPRRGEIVDAQGLRGFVPLSQLSNIRHEGSSEDDVLERLGLLVGQTLPLKVVEINRRRNRLILSERLASQERRGRRKDELINELQEGE